MTTFDLIIITLWLLENTLIKVEGDCPWIRVKGTIQPNLINSTVLIVKDGDLGPDDKSLQKSANIPDLRYSNDRYLMCVGSVLTHLRVLTSASCIHKATYIRHNIRAPLAAMIDWTSSSVQIIGIKRYVVHPDHVVDPRNADYFQHNIAVAILAQSITGAINFQIKLPEYHFGQSCNDNECSVTSIEKIGQLRFEIQEVVPRNTDHHELHKRSISDLNPDYHNPKKRSPSGTFPSNGTWQMEDKNDSFIITFLKAEVGNASLLAPTSGDEDVDNQMSTKDRYPATCVETGSPVMLKGSATQVALLAKSCDNRQPHPNWIYTDLYQNKDWIIKMQGPSYDYEGMAKIKASPRMNCLCSSQNSDPGKCSLDQNAAQNFEPRHFNFENGSLPQINHPYTQSIYDMYLNKACKSSCSNPCGSN